MLRLLLVCLLALALAGCEYPGGIFSEGGIFGPDPSSSTDDTTDTGTDTGTDDSTTEDSTTVQDGTDEGSDDGLVDEIIAVSVSGGLVLALDSSGTIIAVEDTSDRAPGLDRDGDGVADSYAVRLRRVPLGEPLRLFVIADGLLAPVQFRVGSTHGNRLLLVAGGPVDLGFLVMPERGGESAQGQWRVGENPTVGLLGSFDRIPIGVNRPPTAGLSAAELNRRGVGALRAGWWIGARTYFAAATRRLAGQVSNQADRARFFHALSRVGSLTADTLSDGVAMPATRLGDLLDRFGYPDDASRASLAALARPERLADGAPTGAELQTFVATVVAGEIDAAIVELDQVSPTFQAEFGFPDLTDGPSESVQVDYSDVLILRGLYRAMLSVALLQRNYDLDLDFTRWSGLADLDIEGVLERYPGFLSLVDDPVGNRPAEWSLRAGLRDLRDGLLAARDEVAGGDPQDDELFALVDGHVRLPALLTPAPVTFSEPLIAALQASLDGPAPVPTDGPGQRAAALLDLGVLFRGLDFRNPSPGLLPPFDGNRPVGSGPDPTLQGLFGDGRGVAAVVDAIARWWPFADRRPAAGSD